MDSFEFSRNLMDSLRFSGILYEFPSTLHRFLKDFDYSRFIE